VVEHLVANENVEGSNPFTRSNLLVPLYFHCRRIASWPKGAAGAANPHRLCEE
jgi:hypothetical protein